MNEVTKCSHCHKCFIELENQKECPFCKKELNNPFNEFADTPFANVFRDFLKKENKK